MLELPWVSGGGVAADSRCRAVGQFRPATSRFRQEFPGQPLALSFHTQHKLSPSLIWLFHLLAQLTNEYYVTKLARARVAADQLSACGA